MRPLALSALAAVMVAGVGAFAATTEGFTVFTTEGARRASVERDPRPIPDLEFEDQDGRILRLSDWRGRVVLTEFIYTRCPTICSELGQAFARTAEMLQQPLAGDELLMLSISFDPRHDTPAELADYARRHGADGTRWRIVRPRSTDDLEALLARFGVVVIPDGYGGFEHNAAVQIVDGNGRLVRVIDYTPVEAAAGTVRSWLND
ncbi:MAG TPA: SCO family protein [Azospirillum sp.]|nr:SCO family protein [Azospirillum sp.]